MLTHTKADGIVLSESEAVVYCLETAKASLKSDRPFWDLAIEEAKRSGASCITLWPGSNPTNALDYLNNAAEVQSRPFSSLYEQFAFYRFEVRRAGEVLRYGADSWQAAD